MDGSQHQSPDDSTSLEEQSYSALKAQLAQGSFPPGEKLSLRRIAQSLGVSPMPVRAALRRLAAERCIDIQPGGGAVVPLITRAAYQEIQQLRLLLEPEAARAAVPKLSDVVVAEMAGLADKARGARKAGDEDTYRLCDHLLHQRFYATAELPLLMSMIEMAWMRRSPVMAMARPLMPKRRDHDDHAGLLAAARARDAAQAAHVVADEITRASAYVLATLVFPEDGEAQGWQRLSPLRR